MIFIFGIETGDKQLDFNQPAECPMCGRYGSVNIYMTYSYFTLFFIPLFKWGKKYYAKMSCCGVSSELPPKLGAAIEKGEIAHIDVKNIFGA